MGVFFRQMSPADHDEWLGLTIINYAAEKVANGTWSEPESLQRSREAMSALLPQGCETPDQFLFTLTLENPDEKIGFIWFGRQAETTAAYLYDLYVKPAFRRRGYARQAMLELEKQITLRGFSAIALHVFGHNHAAHALYRSVGYQVTDINMSKTISS